MSKLVQVNVKMTEGDLAVTRRFAEEMGLTVSMLIRHALRQVISRGELTISREPPRCECCKAVTNSLGDFDGKRVCPLCATEELANV